MADLAGQQEAADPAVASTESGRAVVLGQRYLIRPGERLHHLDLPHSTACAVEDLQDPVRPLYALLCDPKVPVRSDLLHGLMRRFCPHVISPRAAQVVAVPGQSGRRTAIVLERPGGVPLSNLFGGETNRLGAKEIAAIVLPPVIEALEHLEMRGLTHRGIRPDNMFFTGPARDSIVLGECCSAPPGLCQPAAYESLITATADPDARGEDTIEGDLYALGVAILALASGSDPADGRDERSLTAAKISLGSYAALVGMRRFDSAITALLVGLLTDDPDRRWRFDRLKRWTEGMFDASQRASGSRRAQRGYSLLDKEYFHPRLLAAALGANPSEAVAEVTQGKLEKWVRNVLVDLVAADAIKEAMVRVGKDVDGGDVVGAELIARVCLALDRPGPLRFRDIAVTTSGIGPALARAFADDDRDRLKCFADLLRSSVLMEWTAFAPGHQSRSLPVYLCTSLHSFMNEQVEPGGLERCLYELNPGLPCQSSLVAAHCPANVPGLMAALDEVAATSGSIERMLDRHVAAFIAARAKPMEKRLVAIGRAAPGSPQRVLAAIALFATLQRSIGSAPLHGLAACAVQSLRPLVNKLKSAVRREVMTQKINLLVQDGDLANLTAELDFDAVARLDGREYAFAVTQFRELGGQIEAIDTHQQERAAAADEQGYWIATLLGYAGLAGSVAISVIRIVL